MIPATVPGCVHTDLLDAGLIPDPFLDDNESLLAWIGLVDWTYRTSFAWAPEGADRVDLSFAGLDTVARVTLNGTVLGETANQHRSYRFDVTSALVEGDNALEVAFRSPVKYANAQSVALGARQRPYPLPYDAIRKSACSFGWDWGIATYTSGIVGAVRLESWSLARLAQVRVTARVTGDGSGAIDVVADLERTGDAPLTLSVTAAGQTAIVETAGGDASVTLDLADVDLWWPAGYGEQPLTDVVVELASDGTVLDSTSRRVGFRTVRWDTEPDAAGTPFTLLVNDQPVFVKGANWIPDDALPVRITRDRLRRRFEQALDANLNLIRVWGGGLYESDDFYELARRAGPARLAGLPLRVRRVRRGGAAPLRDRGRSARERRATFAPCLARAADRQQREPLGLRGLGLEAAPRRQDVGRVLLLRPLPRDRRRTRTPRAVRPRQPLQPRRGLGRRAADRLAPERRAARLDAPVGAVEPAATGRRTASTAPASSPNSAGRDHRPGRPSCARSATLP